MIGSENKVIRIAILDLNEGKPNQGMRCINQIITEWMCATELNVYIEEFDVRIKNTVPDTSFDIYISSGGPGDPLFSRFEDWDINWNKWLNEMLRWNDNPSNSQKKHIFFICHSFQLACRYFNAGILTKRKSTAFGIFPVHMLDDGKAEPVFEGLPDPFYAVDSRDYQLIQPNHGVLQRMGSRVLCIEKERRHVPYERAVMAIRFNDHMIGTQFHPEADAIGMTRHLTTEEKRRTVIESYGEEKLNSMLLHLNDPDKIMWTYSHILPNFLNIAVGELEPA
ncbi:MAG: GMP synthase [Chitinophagaceae bacterium]|nr:GMP synthase [Chitinophagaceae bacterium]